MNKIMITTSLIILTFASGISFADYAKQDFPKPETAEKDPPLTQRPLTLPFNKLSNDIISRYEAHRKIIEGNKALENQRERLQVSQERFKKERHTSDTFLKVKI